MGSPRLKNLFRIRDVRIHDDEYRTVIACPAKAKNI
jgi:hypothetical protein